MSSFLNKKKRISDFEMCCFQIAAFLKNIFVVITVQAFSDWCSKKQNMTLCLLNCKMLQCFFRFYIISQKFSTTSPQTDTWLVLCCGPSRSDGHDWAQHWLYRPGRGLTRAGSLQGGCSHSVGLHELDNCPDRGAGCSFMGAQNHTGQAEI